MTRSEEQHRMERMPTGIPGLDTILHGGLLPGSVFIVQGPPGAGKTILANQMCFALGRGGGSALYVTLLAESHGRLLRHLRSLDFFDPALVPSSVYYISAFDTLEQDGLPGILRLLTTEGKARRAGLLVLDGLFVLEERVASDREFRRFVNDVTTLANLLGSRILLLTNDASRPSRPEHTMVDGWLQLGTQLAGTRSMRDLQVRKYRGSDFVSGTHALRIDSSGIRVIPRLETERWAVTELPRGDARVGTGLPGLDQMFGGGLPEASTTLLLGATGLGKTTLGLHYLACCDEENPGLLFGFFESEASIRRKARRLSIPLEDLLDRGIVEILWNSPNENLLDELGHRLLENVARRGVRRLVLDGVDGFAQSIAQAERLGGFLNALATRLRAEGVTAWVTARSPQLIGGEMSLPLNEVEPIAENIVLLRYLEEKNALRRVLSLVKVRDSAFDPSSRSYRITSEGIRVEERVPVEGGRPGAAGAVQDEAETEE